jgi:cystathionine beta-synthase
MTTLDVRTEIYDSILETLGNTPLVRLNQVAYGVACEVVAKVEWFNPGGSVKDRIGVSIIEDAEKRGVLRPGGTVVEATSGNTGIGLAIAAAVKGYKCICVLTDKQSQEKISFLRALGAKVVVTPTNVPHEDPRSYHSVAKQLAAETPNAILANQYGNPVNPLTHYQTTGPEIWRQTGGKIDVFVCGMGTGGTITGVGRFLKEQNPKIQVVGIDPVGSVLADYVKSGQMGAPNAYKVEGIGQDYIPVIYDFNVIDDAVQVSDKESFLMTRRLAREEGIFCGGSSGTAVVGALRYATEKMLGPDKRVVVLLPDSGYRNLSKLYNDQWMQENRYLDDENAQVQHVLTAKPAQELVTVHSDAKVGEVVARMKEYDVSQLPVVDQNGALVGLVNEVHVLKYLLNNQENRATERLIGDVGLVDSHVPTVTPNTTLETVISMFATGQAVIVINSAAERQAISILTKIDLLSYLANRNQP